MERKAIIDRVSDDLSDLVAVFDVGNEPVKNEPLGNGYAELRADQKRAHETMESKQDAARAVFKEQQDKFAAARAEIDRQEREAVDATQKAIVAADAECQSQLEKLAAVRAELDARVFERAEQQIADRIKAAEQAAINAEAEAKRIAEEANAANAAAAKTA